MQNMITDKAARYIALAYGDMRVARAATYGDMNDRALEHYLYTLKALQEAQDFTGIVMIPGKEIAESVAWCTRMLQKIAA